jgi:hypothetical protein
VVGLTAVATGCMAVAAVVVPAGGARAGSGVDAAAEVISGLAGAGRSYWPPVVFGTLAEEGGPVKPGGNGGAPARPLSGIVMFKNNKGRTTDVTADADGRFVARVPAGTYAVTARSPQIEEQSPDGTRTDPPCAGPQTVVVQPDRATQLTLVCYVP